MTMLSMFVFWHCCLFLFVAIQSQLWHKSKCYVRIESMKLITISLMFMGWCVNIGHMSLSLSHNPLLLISIVLMFMGCIRAQWVGSSGCQAGDRPLLVF